MDAKIFTEQINDALFIERPVNVQNYSHQAIFRLAANNKSAERQELSFGAEAGKYIQITSGASENDRFILSDTTRLHDVKIIQIVD